MIPYPSTVAELLSLGGPGNRSLVFDRGMDRYDEKGKILENGKEEFLRSFTEEFRKPDGFDEILERRRMGIELLGARSIRLATKTRLVIGLGLPHPIETGFLLDRTTGCPYLSGSSVKGLLRASARLVMNGELEGDASFWSRETIDRVFGPELGGDAIPHRGEAVFYDVFPDAWPSLEVDVLTPHQGKYYLGGARDYPADWNKPVPVPFLAIKPETTFVFHVGHQKKDTSQDDLARLERLLRDGLDWLGIGAKKSSGYGYFGEPKASKKKVSDDDPPAQRDVTIWSNVVLQLMKGMPTAFKGRQQTATCRGDELSTEVLTALKENRKGIRADIEVVKVSTGHRIARVRKWQPIS